MKRPYAYLRKSRVFRGKSTISPKMQLAEVTSLAERYGDTDLVVLEDMNISGKKGRKGRPGFSQLLEAIEAGAVSAVYSYSLSRLSRSVRDIVDLAEFCAKAGVPIRLAVDPDPDPTSPSGRMILTILAAMAQFEADIASERARDTVEIRRARGDRLGPPPFRDHEVVLRAFDEAGSFAGAAKLLTKWGIPTRNGRRIWQHSSVKKIVGRVAPERLPPPGTDYRGLKPTAPFLFYRLLRCHCGQILTGVRDRRGHPRYACMHGRYDFTHPRPASISERRLQNWMRAEAARLRVPDTEIKISEASSEKQAALRGRLQRLGRAYVEGTIPDAEYEQEKERLTNEIKALELQGRVRRVEPIDWTADPGDVNRELRALWQFVQLGPDLLPQYAVWNLPDWRADDPAA